MQCTSELLFSDSKTMATLVNYTRKSFIKLTQEWGYERQWSGISASRGAQVPKYFCNIIPNLNKVEVEVDMVNCGNEEWFVKG